MSDAGPLGWVPLTGSGLDRRADRRRDAGLIARLLQDPDTLVLPIADGRTPVRVDQITGAAGRAGGSTPIPAAEATEPALDWRRPEAGDARHTVVYLGEADGRERLAALLPAESAGQGWRSLREVGADLGPVDAESFASATSLANWHGTHGFCARCGAPTQPASAGWTRRCTAEGSEHFPRTDPAVIMAVYDPDDRLLLARGAHWPAGRYSVLAGFVEPGESLAMAVAREVQEEVGVAVTGVRYLGDQPWPFPSSLMLGCEAYAADPTLTLDPTEIAEAMWVTREEYRTQVDEGAWGAGTPISISRRLIQRWLKRA